MKISVHPTDGALGESLVVAGVVYSLACDTAMQLHPAEEHTCICDPDLCGWHSTDYRRVAAGYRRFEVPDGNIPDRVWVVPTTGYVPGIIHRKPR